jgi:hypothetical protein
MFCLADMNMSKCCYTYYEHAKILQEDTILQLSTKYFRENILHIPYKWPPRMSGITDAQFWLDLVEEHSEQGTISEIKIILSRYIAWFCLVHKPFPQVFHELTNEKYLADDGIHPEAAIRLLYLEGQILKNDKTASQLTNLQVRCVNAIVRGKKKTTLTSKKFSGLLQKCSRLVLCEIIKRSFYGIPLQEL